MTGRREGLRGNSEAKSELRAIDARTPDPHHVERRPKLRGTDVGRIVLRVAEVRAVQAELPPVDLEPQPGIEELVTRLRIVIRDVPVLTTDGGCVDPRSSGYQSRRLADCPCQRERKGKREEGLNTMPTCLRNIV